MSSGGFVKEFRCELCVTIGLTIRPEWLIIVERFRNYMIR